MTRGTHISYSSAQPGYQLGKGMGQAHRVSAVPGRSELGFPAGEVIAGGKLEQFIGPCPRSRTVAGEAEGRGQDRPGMMATWDNTGAAR